jgi:hypothetical protein
MRYGAVADRRKRKITYHRKWPICVTSVTYSWLVSLSIMIFHIFILLRKHDRCISLPSWSSARFRPASAAGCKASVEPRASADRSWCNDDCRLNKDERRATAVDDRRLRISSLKVFTFMSNQRRRTVDKVSRKVGRLPEAISNYQ